MPKYQVIMDDEFHAAKSCDGFASIETVQAANEKEAAEIAAERYHSDDPCDPDLFDFECYVGPETSSSRSEFTRYAVRAEVYLSFEASARTTMPEQQGKEP